MSNKFWFVMQNALFLFTKEITRANAPLLSLNKRTVNEMQKGDNDNDDCHKTHRKYIYADKKMPNCVYAWCTT